MNFEKLYFGFKIGDCIWQLGWAVQNQEDISGIDVIVIKSGDIKIHDMYPQ